MTSNQVKQTYVSSISASNANVIWMVTQHFWERVLQFDNPNIDCIGDCAACIQLWTVNTATVHCSINFLYLRYKIMLGHYPELYLFINSNRFPYSYLPWGSLSESCLLLCYVVQANGKACFLAKLILLLLHNCIIIGHLDTVLSKEGNKQAELVGIKLQDENFSQVFSSDLTRAKKVSKWLFR